MAFRRKIKKAVKKLHPITILFVVLALLVGALGGYFTCKLITRNDAFTLAGQTEVLLYVGQEYTYYEEGYRAIAYGKDVTQNVVVSSSMTANADGSYTIDTSEEGVFGILYTVSDCSLYKDVKRVRTFRIVTPEGGV